MSQDVKSLLLFRHCVQWLFQREGSKNSRKEWIARERGRQPTGRGPNAETQHGEVHSVNAIGGRKSVSFVFGVVFLLGGEIFFSGIRRIILKVDGASPQCLSWRQRRGVRLELWVKRGSFSFYFEYLRSDGLLKLPVFSGTRLLCFHCSWHVLKAARTANVNERAWCRYVPG